MNKLLTSLLVLGAIYSTFAQNRAPVEVRKTDHTLVWPTNFFPANNMYGFTYPVTDARNSIISNTPVIKWIVGYTFSLEEGYLMTAGKTKLVWSDDNFIFTTNHFGVGTNNPKWDLHTKGTNRADAFFGDEASIAGTVLASNFVFSSPRWTDVVVTSSAFGKAVNAPSDEIVSPGSEIYGKAFEHGEDFAFSIQTIHDLAETNAAFPQFYFEPHIHISTSAHTSGTNATFRLELQVATVWGIYTNAIYHRTNTLTLTNLYQHGILSFGEITNNNLQGHSSVIFRGFMERVNGGAGDIGNTAVVFADSADIHIPFKQIGSANQKGD